MASFTGSWLPAFSMLMRLTVAHARGKAVFARLNTGGVVHVVGCLDKGSRIVYDAVSRNGAIHLIKARPGMDIQVLLFIAYVGAKIAQVVEYACTRQR
jgi:hypothetical protein